MTSKEKVWKAGDSSQPAFPKNYNVTKRWEGTCAEISKNSNKFYHIEQQVAFNGQARIFTTYGRVGKPGTEEYRYYSSEGECLGDYESLIRKKRDRKKDPYREVDLAITAIGSAGAKEIKKPMTGIDVASAKGQSKLHKEVQRLVNNWFGSTGTFIEMNLKCPLGQLSKEQIDKGRNILDDCRNRVLAGKSTTNIEYDRLTSQFYSLIPHVLPHRINPDDLRLNTIDKIMAKNNTLDTFLDAKNIQAVLSKESLVDDKYKQLRTDLNWIDPQDKVHKWIENLLYSTRASNHSYFGKIRVCNVFGIIRHGEDEYFCSRAEEIIKERIQKTQTWPENLVGVGDKRPDINKERTILYERANILPLWHGTRNENMVGILTKGLIKKPAGIVYTGSMFGEASGYWATNSTKSCGYTSCQGAVWSRGRDRCGFLFLGDVCLGNPKIATQSFYYTDKNIKPFHSVWAKAGRGFLINDEIMVYQSSGPGQQHNLRYIVEIETQAK